ncbi:MAG: VOC family protein, partial [Halobacteriales archaeon]|nr:VOC family protein [Halobacteriales archaeon]
LVVDDPEFVERRLDELEVELLQTHVLDFLDPVGNHIQIVGYEQVQFTKADHILDGMGLHGLDKSEAALDELAEKGMAPN